MHSGIAKGVKKHLPKVSIGMPVCNGENYIREAIDSILAQTFEEFELVISDNASTDRTGEICLEYAARDPRIKYVRNPVNIGAAKNYNATFDLSSGEYFKWAAHDDILDRNFLVACVKSLDKDPSVVVCFPEIVKIDDCGRQVGTYQEDNRIRVDSRKPHERFRDLIDLRHWTISVFGLIRSEVLRKTPLIGSYVGSDRCLMAELCLFGPFHRIPEKLFFRRDHAGSSVEKFKLIQKRWGWFDPDKAGKIPFPHWRYVREYIISVRKSPLDLSEKIYCYLYTGRWFIKWRDRLWKDLTIAVRIAIERREMGHKMFEGIHEIRMAAKGLLQRSSLGRSVIEARRHLLRRLR